MNQIGCVLVFKPGVDPNTVAQKLQGLADVVDTNYYVSSDRKNVIKTPDGKAITSLHKFEPAHGGPVWYVP